MNKNIDSNLIKSTPLINNDSIFTQLNTINKIFCKTHQNQTAKSICMDCKTFCCMIDNCGQPHIYHSIENLDYILGNQLIPAMSTLRQINKEMTSNKSRHLSNINTFKNNLRSFAVEEKKKVDQEYHKILQAVQSIYSSYMNDVNDFIDDLSGKFEMLHDKINHIYSVGDTDAKNNNINDKDISGINRHVDGLISQSFNTRTNSLDNEAFLILIAKDAKNFNTKLKATQANLSKFDFDKEIKDIKTRAEKEYPKGDKLEYLKSVGEKITADLKLFTSSKAAKDQDRKSISKIKRMVGMRNTMAGMQKDNYNVIDVDIDIFVRSIFEEINKIRKNPKEGVRYVEEYIDLINNNDEMNLYSNPNANSGGDSSLLNETVLQNTNLSNKISYIVDYLNGLVRAKVSIAPLEWDNDLSNSAEDYLKQTQGKIERDFSTLQKQIHDIVVGNYYSNYVDIMPSSYFGSPIMSKIIMHFFANENYWDMKTRQNILFSDKYNVVGICGTSANVVNKITLIANFSQLL